jgi:hypothetical protein
VLGDSLPFKAFGPLKLHKLIVCHASICSTYPVSLAVSSLEPLSLSCMYPLGSLDVSSTFHPLFRLNYFAAQL